MEGKQVEEIAEAAAKMWFEKNKDRIPELVNNMLNRKLEKIVGRALGFEIDYANEWRVDHCNGRSGDSAAGNWIRQRAGEAVNEWLDKQAGNLPKLPESAVTSLRRDFLNTYRIRVEGEMRRLAERHAVEFARDTVQRVLEKL